MTRCVQKSAFFIHVCVWCSTIAAVASKDRGSIENAEIPLKYKSVNITYDVEKMNLVEAEDFLKLLEPSNDVCWIYCFCTSEKCFTFSCSHLVEITTKILHGNNEKFYVISEVAGAGSVFTRCETFPLNLSNSSENSTVNNTLFAVAQCYTNLRSISEEHFAFLSHDER
ncbi:uncharacterized protein LOC108740993 [Agrilus planipennis]|uniref:Uncharacterized protein LOC108740993 n=1 Tax=Agrilus planipennis TaxID=224129 RepID=A0A1W4XE50_AGRPL|nr:uncharacterized protein LOC108740993 [Agrilus planipennis]